MSHLTLHTSDIFRCDARELVTVTLTSERRIALDIPEWQRVWESLPGSGWQHVLTDVVTRHNMELLFRRSSVMDVSSSDDSL